MNRPNHRSLLLVSLLVAAVLASAGWYLLRKQDVAPGVDRGQRLPKGQQLPNPLACCGYRMQVEGELFIWQAPPATQSGIPVPDDYRTEIFGNVIVAKAPLPPGTYTIEVIGSENSWREPGRRIFDITAISTRNADSPGQGAAPRTEEVTTSLGTAIDLFALAGPGKPHTIRGTVPHAGGLLKVVFTTRADFAKVSAIRVINAAGDKVAWLFAQDMTDLLRLPGDPPKIEGPVVWKDASAPIDRRVADLIKRMTLREKVWQMSHAAPAIERLGLPAYNYWSEALHGVARNGIATVYPQAIGMAASFDPDLMHAVADSISTEARAKFHDKERQLAAGKSRVEWEGGDNGRYQGLTLWSPNINLFRDPRWGRGHETYGEDPHLTTQMGVAFIRGLQGNHPEYYKTIATAKHYAVHSGPEALRHVFDAQPPEADFYDSYLPQFEAAVRQAKVASVMGAYNRVYGEPACASPLLLKDLLRRTWGFEGYVVSDCGAISDIWANHAVVANQAQAAAAAVLGGCDLECGAEYGSLAAAVDLHLVGEGVVDEALGRVLKSRFQLGLFDPPGKVPYAAIRPDQNDSPAHAALALKMAHASIVLLKNDGILPLDATGLKKVALLGPNADGLLPLLGNYNGTPSKPITVVDGLRAALPPGVALTHIKGCDNAHRQSDFQWLPDICLRPALASTTSSRSATGSSGETGLRAEYFQRPDFSGTPAFTRIEKGIDLRGLLEWIVPVPREASPVAAIRYRGDFVAPVTGTYRLRVSGNLPFRWTLNGGEIVDHFRQPDPALSRTVTLQLTAGQRAPMVIDTRTYAGMADLQLSWHAVDTNAEWITPTANILAEVKDADVILFASGFDGHMEAEEGDVRMDYVGFVSGDRTDIEMPSSQTQLVQALVSTGKPVILLNMSGSAIAMPWEAQNLPAIVQAWYPGQAGGQAVADVLFGRYNPAGRLPITFYRATEDLPSFDDYGMAARPLDAQDADEPGIQRLGRTYRYFQGKPLWFFGHGLSFTRFTYGSLALGSSTITPQEPIHVSVEVRNSGNRDGEEVVQVYARPGSQGGPQQRLIGFKRIPLGAGKSERVSFTIPAESLRTWDSSAKRYAIRPGRYRIEVGGSSSDIRGGEILTIR